MLVSVLPNQYTGHGRFFTVVVLKQCVSAGGSRPSSGLWAISRHFWKDILKINMLKLTCLAFFVVAQCPSIIVINYLLEMIESRLFVE